MTPLEKVFSAPLRVSPGILNSTGLNPTYLTKLGFRYRGDSQLWVKLPPHSLEVKQMFTSIAKKIIGL